MQVPATASPRLRVGEFEVDLRCGEVRRNGDKIKLQERPFQVLAALIERPGDVVTREEIRQKLWPTDTFVDFEHSINTAVKKLREALGDDAENPRFIATLPRHGYRLIAPVQSAETNGTCPEPEASPAPPPRGQRTGPWLGLAFFVVAGTALACMLVFDGGHVRSRLVAGTGARPIGSLAVLPLRNLSNDQQQEYFSDGMTDELITDLAKSGSFRVISHTSVERYKDTKRSLPEVARELGVDAIVEGTVLRSNDRVRITAQLIDARSDQHLWADTYEGDVRDVLTLQDKVARQIATQIGIKVAADLRARAAPIRQVNPEAHEAYLRGRYWWHKRGREAEPEGLRYFQRAVEIDPSYAAGWAGVADSYAVMAHHGGLPPNEAMPKAKAAALKALDLDDSLAEAHASLALIKLSYDWDYPGAEMEFKRAIELDPNYPTAHHWYAHYLVVAGRFDEALNEIQLAHQLDPYSATINIWWGLIYYYQGQYERASAQLRSIVELDPGLRSAISNDLAQVYEQQGNDELAVEERQLAFSAAGRPQDGTAVAKAFTEGGPEAYWRERLILLQQTTHRGEARSLTLSLVHSHLRQREETLRSLEQAYQEHSPWLNFMKQEPAFDWLRDEQRFERLAHRIGLPIPPNRAPSDAATY